MASQNRLLFHCRYIKRHTFFVTILKMGYFIEVVAFSREKAAK